MSELLQALSGGVFAFQTFDDNADRKDKRLTQQINGLLDDGVLDQLKTLNEQGAGVFVTVNATDGKGRTKANITAVRALFVDFDTMDEQRPQRLLDLPTPPSMIIESSQNKHHAYWIADGIKLEEFTDLQKALISYFTAQGDSPDKAVHDLSRVMRLDGFYHHKVKNGVSNAPFLTRVIHHGKPYHADELTAWVNSLAPQNTLEKALQGEINAPLIQYDSLAQWVREQAQGNWAYIYGACGYDVGNGEHIQCPHCGGNDRFRFDDHNRMQGDGGWICSQGNGDTVGGDGLSFLIDHVGLTPSVAYQEICNALKIDLPSITPPSKKSGKNDGKWGEIIPLETKGNIYNPYPVEAFGSLAPVVSAIATYAKTPCSMAGQSVLGVLSTIGQIFVNAPFGYAHKPTSLYLLTESPSGAGKTTAQNLAYKAVFEYAKQRHKQFIDDLAEYQANLSGLKGKERGRYIAETHEPKDDSPIIKEATTEGIIDKFILGDFKNVAWASSEAAQFFGGYSMKSDTMTSTLGAYTSLWSDGETQRLRKGRLTPNTRAYDCRFTLDLSGQRIIIEPVMNDAILTAQGFLPRFLLSAEPSLIGNRDWTDSQNPYNDPYLIKFWAKCRELLENDSDCIERVNMPFGKGARHHLALYQNAVESQQKKGQRLANLTAFASRMAENASRIATLFAFFDGKECVSIDELERAFLLVEYSIKEVINYNQRQSDNPKEYEILLNYLVKQSQLQGVERFLYSSIQSKTPKMLRKKEVFELAINTLIDTNHIKVIEIDGTRWIILNPIILQS